VAFCDFSGSAYMRRIATIMSLMKIGTRLTLVLLMAVTPVLVGYTFWTVHRSSLVYLNSLKRDIRATTRSLAPAMETDVSQEEWDYVDELLRRMTDDGTAVALLKPDDSVWRASSPQTAELARRMLDSHPGKETNDEFDARIDGSDWLCRVVPLSSGGKILGYLLVAQDWTDIHEDVAERSEGSAVAALAVIGIIITLIPLLVRRYVSSPLAELSRKVTRFSDDPRERPAPADEVSLLTEEFRKLDDQLNVSRRDLLAKHSRELELERSLQHAERLATVGTLASGLAHEIGTPMGVIRGRAEHLMQTAAGSEKARHGLEIIVNQIDRVSRIVRMLLDYGRSRESHRSVCDLRQILTHAMSLMETEAERRQVQVSAELGDKPLLAECDAGQLEQVFVNLEMNALDAMTPQGGILRIRAHGESNGMPGKLKVVFEDTGPGVAPQDAARVFDPFFTTKELGSGTGMGLAVSQSIIRDHNGEISFESTPSGSRFFVTVPGAAPRPSARAEQSVAKENRT
jgi:two-component system NtrC family sensor kinase